MSADGSSLLLLVCAQSISGSSLSSDLISWSVSGVWIWNLDPRVPSRASTQKVIFSHEYLNRRLTRRNEDDEIL